MSLETIRSDTLDGPEMDAARLDAIPIAVLLALLAYGFGTDPREIPSPLLGRPAADFSLPLFEIADTRAVKLLDQAKELLLQVAPLIAACPRYRQPARARTAKRAKRRGR